MLQKIIFVIVITLITAFFILAFFAALAAAEAADGEKKKRKESPQNTIQATKKIYISGSISNNPDYKQQFAAAEAKLSAEGWEVINPAKVSTALPELPYLAYMQISLTLLFYANAVYMLNGWNASTGAVIERQAAESLGLLIIYQTNE